MYGMQTITDNIKNQTLENNSDCLIITIHKHATLLHRAGTKVQPITSQNRATLKVFIW